MIKTPRPGDRIRLLAMSDDPDPIAPGQLGTVLGVSHHGCGKVAWHQIDVAWVPGAFEIPTVASRMASGQRYAAVLCLGAVIKGDTSHDEHINRAVSLALADIGVHCGLPVLFGVLTCNTLQQAIDRSGGEAGSHGKDRPGTKLGNKGMETAEAALEMVDLLKKLPFSR